MSKGYASLKIRDDQIIAAYRSGLTLRECGKAFNLSFERVAQVIRRDAPNLMRPMHVVPARRRQKVAA